MQSRPREIEERYRVQIVDTRLCSAAATARSIGEWHDLRGLLGRAVIWWARRQLAACRAVICASLWPDPADTLCPPSFRDEALKQITAFANAAHSNAWGTTTRGSDTGSSSTASR